MYYLFFDTETNGLPKNYKGDVRDLDNWPRIIQLAWAVYNEQEILIAKSVDLIQPDGWVIPDLPFWRDNGYSTETNKREGILFPEAIEQMRGWMEDEDVRLLIAHNMAFDYPVIACEMLRYGLKFHRTAEQKRSSGRFCTMKATTNLCKIPGPYGFKYPKLEELHHFLFGEGFENAHDALADVQACARCFFHLKHTNMIEVGV